MTIIINVTGLEKCLLKLDAEAKKLAPEQLLDIVIHGAAIYRDAWKERVPVDTGRYRDSIHIELGESIEGNTTVRIVEDAHNPNDDYPYALALEYGTSKMAAQPSAIPAFETSKPEVMAAMRHDLEVLFKPKGNA